MKRAATPRQTRAVERFDREADVVVIGFGSTGACAATEAAAAGVEPPPGRIAEGQRSRGALTLGPWVPQMRALRSFACVCHRFSGARRAR